MSIPPLDSNGTSNKNQLTGSDVRAGRDFNLGDTNHNYHFGTVSIVVAVCLGLGVFWVTQNSEPSADEYADYVMAETQVPTQDSLSVAAIQVAQVQKNRGGTKALPKDLEPPKPSPSLVSVTIESDHPSLTGTVNVFCRALLSSALLKYTHQRGAAERELIAYLGVDVTPLHFGPAANSVNFSLQFELTGIGNQNTVGSPPYHSDTYYLAAVEPKLLQNALKDWLQRVDVPNDFLSLDS